MLAQTDQTPAQVVINAADAGGSSGQSISIYFTLADSEGHAITNPQVDTASLLIGDLKYDARVGLPDSPLYISLVLDTSGSMGPAYQQMVTAATQAVDVAPEGTRFSIITFNDQVSDRIGFEGNRATVKDTLQKITAKDFGNGTCLYNAVQHALTQATGNTGATRRAVVLFTDGKDQKTVGKDEPCSTNNNASSVTTLSRSVGIPVYTIGITGQQRADAGELQSLAQNTGGLYALGSEGDLSALFQSAIAALAAQRVARTEACLPANTYSGVFSVSGGSSALSSPVNNLRVVTSCAIPTVTPTATATSTPIGLALDVDSFHNEPPNLVFNITRHGAGAIGSYRVQITDRGNLQIDSPKWGDFNVPAADPVTKVSVPLSDLNVDEIVVVVTALDAQGTPLFPLTIGTGNTTPRRTATPTLTPLPSATPTDLPLAITLGPLRLGSTSNERRFDIYRSGVGVIDHYQVEIIANGNIVPGAGQFGSFPVPEAGQTTTAIFLLNNIQISTVQFRITAMSAGPDSQPVAPAVTMDQVNLNFTATPLPTVTATASATATIAPTSTPVISSFDIAGGAIEPAENGDLILRPQITNPGQVKGYTITIVDSGGGIIYRTTNDSAPGDEIRISLADIAAYHKSPLTGGEYKVRINLLVDGPNPTPQEKEIAYAFSPTATPTPTPQPGFMEQVSQAAGRLSTQVQQSPLLGIALVAFVLALIALTLAAVWWMRDRRKQNLDLGYVGVSGSAAGGSDTEINDQVLALLTIVQSPGMTPGTEYEVSSRMSITLGRNQGEGRNGIAFQEKGVSGDHATISFDPNQFYIIDENSSNGTFVNGERLVPGRAYPLPLQPPQTIKLGADTELRFAAKETKSAAAAAGQASGPAPAKAANGAASPAAGSQFLPPSVKATLTVLESPDLAVNKVIPVETRTFWIGTQEDAQLRLQSTLVSRKHALLRWENDMFLLRDNQSRNGVWLDKTKLEPQKDQPLSPGREITISLGRGTRFSFRYTDSSRESETQLEDDYQTDIEVHDPLDGFTQIDEDPAPAMSEDTNLPKQPTLNTSGLPNDMTVQLREVATGKPLEFKEGKAYLNRSVLTNAGHVSLCHAVIYWDAEQNRFYLKDENSSNGTFIEQTRLPSGDHQLLKPNQQYAIFLAKNSKGPIELSFFYDGSQLPDAAAQASSVVEDLSSQTMIDEPTDLGHALPPDTNEHTET